MDERGLPSTDFVSKEFMLKLYNISVDLNTKLDYLMAIMAFESWFNLKAKIQRVLVQA